MLAPKSSDLLLRGQRHIGDLRHTGHEELQLLVPLHKRWLDGSAGTLVAPPLAVFTLNRLGDRANAEVYGGRPS
jgi:hypothetical protein